MANNGAIVISADFSEIKDLERKLAAARERPHKVRAQRLQVRASEAKAEMERITAAYPSPLDELASNIEMEGTPVHVRIFTTKRQGHFLHFGSPSTGAPRDWAHGPAQSAAERLFDDLSAAADPLQ